MSDPSKRQQLLDDGFCVFPGLLDGDLLARLRLASDRLLDAYPEEGEAAPRQPGQRGVDPFPGSGVRRVDRLAAHLGGAARAGLRRSALLGRLGHFQGAALHAPVLAPGTGCGGRSRRVPTRCRTSCS